MGPKMDLYGTRTLLKIHSGDETDCSTAPSLNCTQKLRNFFLHSYISFAVNICNCQQWFARISHYKTTDVVFLQFKYPASIHLPFVITNKHLVASGCSEYTDEPTSWYKHNIELPTVLCMIWINTQQGMHQVDHANIVLLVEILTPIFVPCSCTLTVTSPAADT